MLHGIPDHVQSRLAASRPGTSAASPVTLGFNGALMSAVLQVKHRKDVRLYYGTFDAKKTAYLDQVPSWEALGITVKHVYSDDGQGYVQDAFEKACPSASLSWSHPTGSF